MVDAVVIKDLSWKYQGSEDWVLKGINLRIKQNEFLVIAGPTGAGKSTLAKCLNGLVPHNFNGKMKGEIKVLDMLTRKKKLSDLTNKVAMVFQEPESQFIGMSVSEDIVFGPENMIIPREEILKRLDWALDVVRLKDIPNKPPHELSGGQKQRVAIASALAMMPEIMVLDEPTSELDPVGKAEVFSIIKELQDQREMTIILVEHLAEEYVKYADRIILLDQGEIRLDAEPCEFFECEDMLVPKGVHPPSVASFFNKLKQKNIFAGQLPLTIKDGVKAFKKLKTTGKLKSEASEFKVDGNPLIRSKDVRYTYADGTEALCGIDLEVMEGDFVAFIGQNGSGKTTLAKHFNGLLRPSKGNVFVYGLNTQTASVSTLTQKVGYVFQNPDHMLTRQSVEDEIAFGPSNLSLSKDEITERVERNLELLELVELREKHPIFLNKSERQRVAIASMLAMNPEVLIVDEPTTGMDMRQSYESLENLKKLHNLGHTIIIITHNMQLVAEYASRVVVMAQGRIILDGPTRDIYAQPELLAKTFLKPPQITRFAQKLREYGVPKDIMSVDELCQIIEPSR